MTRVFGDLRRDLAAAGGRPASDAALALYGSRDALEYRPARLVETPLRHIDPGPPLAWDDDVAFLDGIQQTELLGYVGTSPLLGAIVAAAVRRRSARRLSAATETRRHFVIGRQEALDALAVARTGFTALTLDDSAEAHPLRDLERARVEVDRARVTAEVEVARRFRASDPDTWIVVDGSLAVSPLFSTDRRAIGVIKGHAVLPFAGADLETYLTLPRGMRTSVFVPASQRVTPVYSWALRLADFAGRDLFHGLVRVEMASDCDADMVSRHLLAERSPRARDPRADRLLYGVHDVERYLEARSA